MVDTRIEGGRGDQGEGKLQVSPIAVLLCRDRQRAELVSNFQWRTNMTALLPIPHQLAADTIFSRLISPYTANGNSFNSVIPSATATRLLDLRSTLSLFSDLWRAILS